MSETDNEGCKLGVDASYATLNQSVEKSTVEYLYR